MGRTATIDGLRGLAVVLMIQTHAFDAFSRVDSHVGPFYKYIKLSGGVPAPIFLFLSGVSLCLGFASAERAGLSFSEARAKALRRALGVLGYAFLFRLQGFFLGGSAHALLRVDVLNCMAVSLTLATLTAAPRPGRTWNLRAIGISLAIALGSPLVAQLWPAAWAAHFPGTYVFGEKPMVLFPLFPWSAFAFAGLAAGGAISAAGRDPKRMARVMAAFAGLGVVLFLTGYGLHASSFRVYPHVNFWLHSPNFFLVRVGLLLIVLSVVWLAYDRLPLRGFDPLKQLGLTSLIVYFVHVELCYGKLARPFRQSLGLSATAGVVVGLTLLMLALSIARTRLARFWTPPKWRA